MSLTIKNIGIDDTDYRAEGAHKCRRCAGTGQFITYVENGKPKGPGGICFRCGGKGYHTQQDRKRNNGYDCRGYYQAHDGAHHNVVDDHRNDTRRAVRNAVKGSLDDLI
jgi:hypothetical protein